MRRKTNKRREGVSVRTAVKFAPLEPDFLQEIVYFEYNNQITKRPDER